MIERHERRSTDEVEDAVDASKRVNEVSFGTIEEEFFKMSKFVGMGEPASEEVDGVHEAGMGVVVTVPLLQRENETLDGELGCALATMRDKETQTGRRVMGRMSDVDTKRNEKLTHR